MYKSFVNSFKVFLISLVSSFVHLNVKALNFIMKRAVTLTTKPPFLTLGDKLYKTISESKLDPVHTNEDYYKHPVLARLRTEVERRTSLMKEKGAAGLIRRTSNPETYENKLNKELSHLNKDASAAVISQRFAEDHKSKKFLEELADPEKMKNLVAKIQEAGGPKKYLQLQADNAKELDKIRADVDKEMPMIENLTSNIMEEMNTNKTFEVAIEVDDSDFYPPLKPHLTGDTDDKFYQSRKKPVASKKKKIVTAKKKVVKKTPVKKSSKNKKR